MEDELEQVQEIRDEVSQIKNQMSKMMEILQSMQKEKNTEGNPPASTEGQPATPLIPPGFTHIPIQGFNQPGVTLPLTIYPGNQTHMSFDPSNPPYGLPRGFVPPVAHDSQDDNPNATQTQIPPNATEVPQAQNTNPLEGDVPVIVHPTNLNTSPYTIHIGAKGTPANQNFGFSQHMPVNQPGENLQSKEKLEVLEERLRAIEGINSYGLRDASELCLVPNVVIPPKFKVPDFDKYKGTTCPKNHLTTYVRKMASYAQDDKLLIHFFQDSLAGAASNWYTHLERTHIRSFRDLADAFLKQYKYNIDMAPDRMQLQTMSKKDTETFKEYAQRWRELAAQVEPPLAEKEIVAMFIDTLQSPFYDRMIGSVSSNFSDMVVIGERIEGGMRNGKIPETSMATGPKKPLFGKRREGEAHAVTFEPKKPNQWKPNQTPVFQAQYVPYYQLPPYQQPNQPYIATTSQFPNPQPQTPYRPSYPTQPQTHPAIQPRVIQPPNLNANTSQTRPPYNPDKRLIHFDPIPMSYTELYRQLVSKSVLSPIPTKPMDPPYPRWYDPNTRCEYHDGAVGHSTENCKALKFKVQDLINAKWLSFQKDAQNGAQGPMPNHGGSGVNAIENFSENILKSQVTDIKTPMRVIFQEMCKRGFIQTPLIKEKDHEGDLQCDFDRELGHSIEDCIKFRKIVQQFLDSRIIQIGCKIGEDSINMVSESAIKVTPFTVVVNPQPVAEPVAPKPVVIYYTEKEPLPTANGPTPIVIQVPGPFAFKDTKAVPWKYEVHMQPNSFNGSTSVTNISGIGGMTRSGRIYTPESLQKGDTRKEEKGHKGKEKDERTPYETETGVSENRREVSDEDVDEFLKFIKQSEYKVVDQLNRTPARISLLSLLMNSEPHRRVLMKVLNQAHVSHDITTDKLDNIVSNIVADNYITFTDDEIPIEGMGHNKALHISVKCREYTMARVLIDNGSSLNVMPKSTLTKLPFDRTHMKPSTMIVRAFDGTRREVMGEIELPIQVGPCTFEVLFQVMDITPTYSCLLGRPWIHSSGAIPSTLHQKVKFIVDGKLITVFGEEDMLVSKPAASPYIEAAEEALETAFQSLEIANATYVGEGSSHLKPQLSKASIMMAKVMLESGYRPGSGIGKNSQGISDILIPTENKDKFGLGYKPTKTDRMRVIEERKEKRLARLENREYEAGRIPICDIHQNFRSAGFVFLDQAAVIENDYPVNHSANLVYACSPETELNNWDIIEFPRTLESLPK